MTLITTKPNVLKLALANQLANVLSNAAEVKHIIDENSFLIIRRMHKSSTLTQLPPLVMAYVKSNPRWIPVDQEFAKFEASGLYAYLPDEDADCDFSYEDQRAWLLNACMDMTHRIASRDYRGNRCEQSTSGCTMTMLELSDDKQNQARVMRIAHSIEDRMT